MLSQDDDDTGLPERRRSNQEESEGDADDRELEQQDHHESEDEDTAREVALQDDDHINDEIAVPPAEENSHMVSSNENTSSLQSNSGNSHNVHVSNHLISGIRGVSNARGSTHVGLMSSAAPVRFCTHRRNDDGRISPDPIDPIDIDYDPSTGAHDSEIQGDHDADGDHFYPASPNMVSLSNRYSSRFSNEGGNTGGDTYRTRRGNSHQHEHFELSSFTTQPSETTNYMSPYTQSPISPRLTSQRSETTEHLQATSTNNVLSRNSENVSDNNREPVDDQSEERQDVAVRSDNDENINSVTQSGGRSDENGESIDEGRRIEGEGYRAQHQHSYGMEDRDHLLLHHHENENSHHVSSTTTEIETASVAASSHLIEEEDQSADRFASIRQYTPPAERSIEFGDADLTSSDHEEFDSIHSNFVAVAPNSYNSNRQIGLQNNSNDANSMDAAHDQLSNGVYYHHPLTNSRNVAVPGERTDEGETIQTINQNSTHRHQVLSSNSNANNSPGGGVRNCYSVQPSLVLPQTSSSVSGGNTTNTTSSSAHWDLIRFPLSFFQQAEKEDDILHRDGGAFPYCGGYPNITQSTNDCHGNESDERRGRENENSQGDSNDSRRNPSARPNARRDTCFIFDPSKVSSELETQLDISACGPTAVVNVLRIMRFNVQPYYVARRVPCRQIDNLAPLPEYLLSRSVAGSTHEHLIRGIEEVTQGEVSGRFFSFYPQRDVCLRHWLIYWMKKGCVPVLTLNYQKKHPEAANKDLNTTPSSASSTHSQSLLCDISDSWHHQAVIGVDQFKVYLANVSDQVHVSTVSFYLCSDSKLSIRWKDVASRFDQDSNLNVFTENPHQDPRWTDFNVLGQICSLLRMKKRIDFATANNMGGANTTGNMGRVNLQGRMDLPEASQSESINILNGREGYGDTSAADAAAANSQRSINENVTNSPNAQFPPPNNQNEDEVGGLGNMDIGSNSFNNTNGTANIVLENSFRHTSTEKNDDLYASLLTSHITIPCIAQAGVTIFCNKNATSVFGKLMNCEDLKVATNPNDLIY